MSNFNTIAVAVEGEVPVKKYVQPPFQHDCDVKYVHSNWTEQCLKKMKEYSIMAIRSIGLPLSSP